jgi:hypothetical protein
VERFPEQAAYNLAASRVKGTTDFLNVPPLIGRLVSSGMASLAELQTIYSLEDAMQLDEILRLRNYHEWLATRKEDG